MDKLVLVLAKLGLEEVKIHAAIDALLEEQKISPEEAEAVKSAFPPKKAEEAEQYDRLKSKLDKSLGISAE